MGDPDRTAVMRFFAGLAAVISIGVLVWLIFFRGDTADKDRSRQNTVTHQTKTDQDEKKVAANTPVASSPSTGSNNGGNQQLAETGPGPILTIFGLATITGGGVHYAYRRRYGVHN